MRDETKKEKAEKGKGKAGMGKKRTWGLGSKEKAQQGNR
jgi:hypothetical protein